MSEREITFTNDGLAIHRQMKTKSQKEIILIAHAKTEGYANNIVDILNEHAALLAVKEAAERISDKIVEWEDDLDETACPNGFVTCPYCEAGGLLAERTHYGPRTKRDKERYEKHPPKHKDGCIYVLFKAAINDANKE